MPIYEYRCDGCAQVFEVFQRHDDPPPTSHGCGSTDITRVLSNTSFVLKGTGWYVTDYGRRGSDAKKAGGTKGDDGQAASSKGGDGTRGGDTAASDGGGAEAPASDRDSKASAPATPAAGGGSHAQGRSAPASG